MYERSAIASIVANDSHGQTLMTADWSGAVCNISFHFKETYRPPVISNTEVLFTGWRIYLLSMLNERREQRSDFGAAEGGQHNFALSFMFLTCKKFNTSPQVKSISPIPSAHANPCPEWSRDNALRSGALRYLYPDV